MKRMISAALLLLAAGTCFGADANIPRNVIIGLDPLDFRNEGCGRYALVWIEVQFQVRDKATRQIVYESYSAVADADAAYWTVAISTLGNIIVWDNEEWRISGLTVSAITYDGNGKKFSYLHTAREGSWTNYNQTWSGFAFMDWHVVPF